MIGGVWLLSGEVVPGAGWQHGQAMQGDLAVISVDSASFERQEPDGLSCRNAGLGCTGANILSC